MDKFIELEGKVATQIDLQPFAKDRILPYPVLVAMSVMAGAIAVRQRNIFLRTTVPVLCGAATFTYLYPNEAIPCVCKCIKASQMAYNRIVKSNDK